MVVPSYAIANEYLNNVSEQKSFHIQDKYEVAHQYDLACELTNDVSLKTFCRTLHTREDVLSVAK